MIGVGPPPLVPLPLYAGREEIARFSLLRARNRVAEYRALAGDQPKRRRLCEVRHDLVPALSVCSLRV
jgi:hypothetical protein